METPEQLIDRHYSEQLKKAHRSYSNEVSNIDKCKEIAQRVFEVINDYDPDIWEVIEPSLSLSLSRWCGQVEVSGFPNKETFDQVFVTLIEEFGEPQRDKYGEDIRYTWKPETTHGIGYLYLTVNPLVTGCRLVKKRVRVPKKVIDAHYEEKFEIECNHNDEEE